MDRLDKAIEAFEDESSSLTLGDRVSLLRQALMWNAFEAIQTIKKHGKKSPISEDEEYKQVECMKQFKDIEKMYTSQLRANKISGKAEGKMDDDFLKAIRDMKSSVGTIIRDLNERHG